MFYIDCTAEIKYIYILELGKREIKGDGDGEEVSLEADMTFLVPRVSTAPAPQDHLFICHFTSDEH